MGRVRCMHDREVRAGRGLPPRVPARDGEGVAGSEDADECVRVEVTGSEDAEDCVYDTGSDDADDHVCDTGSDDADECESMRDTSSDDADERVSMRDTGSDDADEYVSMGDTGSDDAEEKKIKIVRKRIIALQLDMKRVAKGKNGRLQRGALVEAERINTELISLVWTLHSMQPLVGLTRIAEAKMADIDLTAPIVYVRVNLRTTDAYIGETEDWNARVKKHFSATYWHSKESGRPCKGCSEHGKYKKHQVVRPYEWVTLPLMSCKAKYEAKRIERMLIKRY